MKSLSLIIILISIAVSTFAKDSESTTHAHVNIKVTEKGFEPNKIDVAPDKPISLSVTRVTDSTCSTSIQIPSQKIKKELPLNKTVIIELGKLAKGEIRFGCGMNMMDSGMIYVK